jgi:hypothetical protein
MEKISRIKRRRNQGGRKWTQKLLGWGGIDPTEEINLELGTTGHHPLSADPAFHITRLGVLSPTMRSYRFAAVGWKSSDGLMPAGSYSAPAHMRDHKISEVRRKQGIKSYIHARLRVLLTQHSRCLLLYTCWVGRGALKREFSAVRSFAMKPNGGLLQLDKERPRSLALDES